MRFRCWRGVVGGLGLALIAAAPAAAAPTLLNLSATASVSVPPDELSASLRATATAPGAERAQAEVNRAVAAALATVRAVPGVHATTAGYATWQHPLGSPGGDGWQASQSLLLKAHDGPALLRLLGSLQSQGLAVEQLAWELSAPAQQAAHDRATDDALGRLRAWAASAARVLGLRFGSFRSVRLGPPPVVMPRPLFASAAGPQPSAAATDIAVRATVSAEVVLLPARGAAAHGP